MANINTNTDQGEINYDICEKQGEIYEYMASLGYDIKQFSNLFLSSDFCNDCFDKCWSLYHDASPYESFYEKMEPEFGDKLTKYNGRLHKKTPQKLGCYFVIRTPEFWWTVSNMTLISPILRRNPGFLPNRTSCNHDRILFMNYPHENASSAWNCRSPAPQRPHLRKQLPTSSPFRVHPVPAP